MRELYEQVPLGDRAALVDKFLGNLEQKDELFAGFFADLLVVDAVNARDEKALTRILSSVPVEMGGNCYLELYLARAHRGACFGCLFSAYDNATNSVVKKSIATCLGRAFPEMQKNRTEGKFVKDVLRWYEEHKNSIAVNENYYLPNQCVSLTKGEPSPRQSLLFNIRK